MNIYHRVGAFESSYAAHVTEKDAVNTVQIKMKYIFIYSKYKKQNIFKKNVLISNIVRVMA